MKANEVEQTSDSLNVSTNNTSSILQEVSPNDNILYGQKNGALEKIPFYPTTVADLSAQIGGGNRTFNIGENVVGLMLPFFNGSAMALNKDYTFTKGAGSFTFSNRTPVAGDTILVMYNNLPSESTEKVSLDLLIVAGQSNSVCYTGTNGASLDVAAGAKVFEFRATTKQLKPFANPVGEPPSDAGAILNYTTGGTFFGSLGKAYTDETQRTLCVLPCGYPGAATNVFYSGGFLFTMILQRVAAFKEWLAAQSTYTLGRIMLVWHQGESGTADGTRNIKQATKKVFDDLKAAIPDLDQCFFCRISQNALMQNSTAKSYNDLFLQLNSETDYVLVHANAMKYYWLNQFADNQHYDQYACNDMGKEIGTHLAQYYTNGRSKPNVAPFEKEKGAHAFSEFTGLTITNNQLCYFVDSIDGSKRWALGSSLYTSYAEIKNIVLNEQTTKFDFSFNLKKGDTESVGLSPVLGGSGSITIGANTVELTDGIRTVSLSHNVSPFIVRGGLITKLTTNNIYRIVKDGGNFKVYANGMLTDTKAVPAGFSATFNQLLKNGSSYLEGVATGLSLTYEQGRAPGSGFDYSDTVKNTYIIQNETVVGDEVVINSAADGYKQTLLNAVLQLDTTKVWQLEAKFTVAAWGVGNYFTLLGTASADMGGGIYALQVSPTSVRFFANADCDTPHGLSLALNTPHVVKLSSNGSGSIAVTINGTVCPSVTLPASHSNVACKCRCVGQSFYSGGSMGHAGRIHYMHIS